MSYPPGVPIARSIYATTTVPSGAMVVQMAPVRQVAMPMMVRPVMQTVISQPRPAFVSIPQQIPQIMNPTQIMQPQGQQIWINSAVAASSGPKLTTDEKSTENNELNNDVNEPAITLFIGNITERATDTLVRQILMHCGSVHSWKRVQGASGKLQAFGFCEYKDPESALRAIHILHDRQLGEKKLLVKVDAKSQELIDEWKKEKGMNEENEDGSKVEPSGIAHARANIELMLSEYASELNMMKLQVDKKEDALVLPQHQQDFPTVRESKNVEENLEELELEKDKKEFISKEIRSFRESQKLQEEQTKGEREEREKEKLKEKDRERSKREPRDGEREKEKTRERERRRTRTPRRSVTKRSRTRSPRRRSPIRRRTPPRRSPIRSSSRRLSPPPRRRRSPSGSPSWKKGDDDDQASERRRLERKIREKEAAYQERLGAFEQRERRKKRDLEKRDERDLQQRKDMVREAKRLREFLADYDDDRSDSKYYVGSSLGKRQRERERERDLDERDRKKEQEEVEILRKRLIQEDHPDHDAAIAKVILETENMWKPLIEPDTPPRKLPSPKPAEESSSGSSSDEDSDDSVNMKSESSDSASETEKNKKQAEQQMVPSLQLVDDNKANTQEVSNGGDEVNTGALKMEFYNPAKASPSTPNSNPPVVSKPILSQSNVFETKMETNHSSTQLISNQKRKKLTVSDVFNQDEEEDELPKKRKLVPLQYTDEERKALNPLKTAEDEKKQAEKKRKMVRALIERIPTQKDDLFDYTLDWSMVDDGLMEKRIQPWITKKIMEYIGEEEPTLVEFICSKILTKSSPEKILEDISMVLDDEAEVFVVKMWRLLIYETEAKKEGLTK